MQADLSELPHLTVDSTVELLEKRFNESLPYTAANDSTKVIIAVNPLREVPGLNGRAVWTRSDDKVAAAVGGVSSSSPHVYDVSAGAIHRMQSLHRNKQTIIVSGESGAGKTVHTTILVEHIAKKNGTGRPNLINRTLAANPVMEAFGNASTAANENSSRFGKMLVLGFDDKGGLQSTRVNPFLFERTRVMNKPSSERNFHIFYQFLAGIATYGPRLKSALGVLHEHLPEHFAILRQHSKSPEEVSTMWQRDRQEASRTLRALSCLEVTQVERMNLMYGISSILHLGNVVFVDNGNKGGAEISAETRGSAIQAARLMGLSSVEELEAALLERIVSVRGESIRMRNTVAQCEHARDSLGRDLYARVFSWIIASINQDLDDDNYLPAGHPKSISLLDVMGFEVQEKNSLEQLLINYCNEKLQFEFSKTMIFQIQQEYLSEGIPQLSSSAEPPRSTLGVFEDPTKGLWALLDQECFVPGGTDSGFVRKVGRAHGSSGGNSHQQQQVSTGRLLPETAFVIQHYAGQVQYTADGILEKSLSQTGKAVTYLLDDVSPLGRFFNVAARGKTTNNKSSVQRTVGMRFKNELETLLSDLNNADDVAWVRCIRPNSSKNPQEFHREMVARQIQASGVIPAVSLARSAFPHSMKTTDFSALFAPVMTKAMDYLKNEETTPDHGKKKSIVYGKTRVYLSRESMEVMESMLKAYRKEQATILLQSLVRARQQRRAYVSFLNALRTIQARFRFRRHMATVRRAYRNMVVLVPDQHLDESHLQGTAEEDLSSISGSTISTFEDEEDERRREEENTSFISFAAVPDDHDNSDRTIRDEYEMKLEETAKRLEVLERESEERERVVSELNREIQRLREAGTVDVAETSRVLVRELIQSNIESLTRSSSSPMPWKNHRSHSFKDWTESRFSESLHSLIAKPSRLFLRGGFTTGGCLVLLGRVEQMMWHEECSQTVLAVYSKAEARMELVHDWVLDAIESDWSDSE